MGSHGERRTLARPRSGRITPGDGPEIGPRRREHSAATSRKQVPTKRPNPGLRFSGLSLVYLAAVVVLFAAWVTTHALLCYHLAYTSVRRGLIAVVCFPMAVVWAKNNPKLRVAWIAFLVLYLVGRVLTASSSR
jgi:hypothetical protein